MDKDIEKPSEETYYGLISYLLTLMVLSIIICYFFSRLSEEKFDFINFTIKHPLLWMILGVSAKFGVEKSQNFLKRFLKT